MQEHAVVIDVEDNVATVRVESSVACKTCPANSFCCPSGKNRIVDADNTLGARVGDTVIIGIASKISIGAVFLIFGLPVILGLVGIIAGSRYGDTFSGICGVGGIIVGLVIAKNINDILTKKKRMLPCIREIVSRQKT
jgi:sigma-E factor negative regulatory protein RseC